jgi:hypothetical protein
MLANDSISYAAAFSAIELIAASQRVNLHGLHHRYREITAVMVLRMEAAKKMRVARKADKATAAKVWARHRSQVQAIPLI